MMLVGFIVIEEGLVFDVVIVLVCVDLKMGVLVFIDD